MNKENILDYLYGEMDLQARLEFEKKLQNDAALQSELRELQQVRAFLGQSKDIAPNPINMVVNTTHTTRKLSRWWAIAASLLILVVAGKMLDLRIESSGSHLVVGFGPLQSENTTSPEIMKAQYASLQQAITDLQKQISTQAEPRLQSSMVSETDLSEQSQQNQKLAGWIVNAVKQEQSMLENRLSNKILEDQQVYMQGVAQDLMRYWNEQRKDDLQMISTSMQSLVQALQLQPQDLAQFVNNTQQNY